MSLTSRHFAPLLVAVGAATSITVAPIAAADSVLPQPGYENARDTLNDLTAQSIFDSAVFVRARRQGSGAPVSRLEWCCRCASPWESRQSLSVPRAKSSDHVVAEPLSGSGDAPCQTRMGERLGESGIAWHRCGCWQQQRYASCPGEAAVVSQTVEVGKCFDNAPGPALGNRVRGR